MHIVISTKLFQPIIGGSIVYASMLAREFSRLGHEVTLITRTPGPPLLNEAYTLLREVSFGNKLRLAANTDILLQVDASWQDALPFIIRGVPWFPTIHRGKFNLRQMNVSGKIRFLLEWLAYRNNHSIAVSQTTANVWKPTDPPILNPYDDECFYEPEIDAVRDVDILFVGSMVRHKGILVLADALQKIPKNETLKVVFVGEGQDLYLLLEAIKALPHHIQVIVAGPADKWGVANWMRRSRVLAFPTTPDWHEASPLTPLEAAACGCRIVASNSGGTFENVSPSHWLVEPGCAIALARALGEALEMKDLAQIDLNTREMLESRKAAEVARQYIQRFNFIYNIPITK